MFSSVSGLRTWLYSVMTSQYHYGDHLNKMDNAAYDKDFENRGNVELGAMMLPQEVRATLAPATMPNGHTISCSDACYNLHQQHQQNHAEKMSPKPTESPWHHLKTIFLIGTIVFLALWILIYTLLSQLDVL